MDWLQLYDTLWAGLVTLATSLGMTGFMGIFLSMLASLKLMDVNAFANSFEKYDLVTKCFQLYGKAYPFIELLVVNLEER